jgi:hypothetical protein
MMQNNCHSELWLHDVAAIFSNTLASGLANLHLTQYNRISRQLTSTPMRRLHLQTCEV